MSEENVEIVRQALEKWNRGDRDALDEIWDDDVVLRTAEGWPERVFFGKAAVRSLFVVRARSLNPATGRPVWRSYWGAHEDQQTNPLDEKSIAELLDAAVPVILRERSRVRQRRVKRASPQ